MNDFAGLPSRARMAAVTPPIIPHIRRLIERVPGTQSLGQGVVYFEPPATLIKEGFDSATTTSAYGAVLGNPDLRDAFARYLSSTHGYDASDLTARVAVTAGANMAFLQTVMAITQPGDEIILLEPFYFNHEMAIQSAGCRPVSVATTATGLPDLTAIDAAITEKTRAIVTVSPNNPSGVVYPPALLRSINQRCRDRLLYHISDEAYESMVFGDVPHFAPGAARDNREHTIALYSMSKGFAIASLRIGYAVLPEHLLAPFEKMQDTNLICPNLPAQSVATTLLNRWHDDRLQLIEQVATQRSHLAAALRSVQPHVSVANSTGALYLWLSFTDQLTSMTVAERLINEFKVAVIPGTAFCPQGHENHAVRVSFGGITGDAFHEASTRLVEGLHRILC